ncbi:hypothetical protein ACINLE_17610 [Bacillus sp. z60-18]|uniref:hypothetical protein n=1 Tax=unclassified Bacillus (in: firmicutes) TaxID=185979 RepID=UPI00390CABA1
MFNPSDWYITPQEYERAAQHGVSKKRLNERIRQYGWGKERAITTPVQKRTTRAKWVEVAEANGIPRYTFYSRVCVLAWDEEQAATVPTLGRSETMRRGQKKSPRSKYRRFPAELIEQAKSNGINYNTFCFRVNKLGMEPSEAAIKPVRSHKEVSSLGLTACKEKYGNPKVSLCPKRRAAN